MSRILSELLEAKEPTFTQTIQELEASSSHPTVDIRLTAEIEQRVHQKLKELGLDPRDTNGPELYQSLQDLVGIHDIFLARALGASEPTDVNDLLPRLVKVVKTLPVSQSCWALKQGSLRRLLKLNPPKKTMKHLGYRSIDSMLKRENIALVMAASQLLEPPQWRKRLVKSYADLDTSDFEIRHIEILLPTSEPWQVLGSQFANRAHHNILELRELGAAVVLPLPVRHLRGASIMLLSMLLYHINELRLYSTFFKMQQVKPHFGTIISGVLLHDTPSFATLAGQQLHWRVLHRYFGREHTTMAALFEPHVQLEDLEWRQAEQVLYRIEPALKFWEDLDFIGTTRGDKPISFNLLDNALNYCNELAYGNQTTRHMQSNLWDELYIRYLKQDSFTNQITSQFAETPGQEVLREMRHQGMAA